MLALLGNVNTYLKEIRALSSLTRREFKHVICLADDLEHALAKKGVERGLLFVGV